MTNAEILIVSLDGFKDGFQAAVNRLAERLDGDDRASFLEDMAEIQKAELQKAARIWDMAFLDVAQGAAANR